MDKHYLLVFTAVCFLYVSVAQECDPQSNCLPPSCRCYLDPSTPGGFNRAQTPQIVVITMDYVLNEEYEPLYNQIFNVNNPNGCPIRGTFFVQDTGTNYGLAKRYYDNGFEIGINSLDGTIPTTLQEWLTMIRQVKTNLLAAGINAIDIRGIRPPQLSIGGNQEFTAMGDENLMYDAGCVSNKYNVKDLYKWPFSYDFPPTGLDVCTAGLPPDIKYPDTGALWQIPYHVRRSEKKNKLYRGSLAGTMSCRSEKIDCKWEVLVADLTWNGSRCASPASCPDVITEQQAFNLLYDNFAEHYEGNRAPFILVLDPVWLKTDYKLDGTVRFVDYIRAAFQDTWVVTAYQLLQWTLNPVNVSSAGNFPPWKCN